MGHSVIINTLSQDKVISAACLFQSGGPASSLVALVAAIKLSPLEALAATSKAVQLEALVAASYKFKSEYTHRL